MKCIKVLIHINASLILCDSATHNAWAGYDADRNY